MSSHASHGQVPGSNVQWNAMDRYDFFTFIFQVAGISTQPPGVQARKKSLVKYLTLTLLVVSPCAWHTFLLWIFRLVASQHPLPKQQRNRGKSPWQFAKQPRHNQVTRSSFISLASLVSFSELPGHIETMRKNLIRIGTFELKSKQ